MGGIRYMYSVLASSRTDGNHQWKVDLSKDLSEDLVNTIFLARCRAHGAVGGRLPDRSNLSLPVFYIYFLPH